MKGSVLLPWTNDIGWKQQSILLSGLRGPDYALLPNVKKVCRWMRAISQNNADPSKDYMRDDGIPLYSSLEKELEHSPCHFVHHFADALRVIGINHPVEEYRNYANGLHEYIAEEIFHWIPETKERFIERHRDAATTIG